MRSPKLVFLNPSSQTFRPGSPNTSAAHVVKPRRLVVKWFETEWKFELHLLQKCPSFVGKYTMGFGSICLGFPMNTAF